LFAVKIGRLLVAACAALALVVACASGELRGAVDDDGSDVGSMADSLDALPAVAGVTLPAPPQPAGKVFIDLQFPPSRVATADVFRPPQG
jgi:hypothetical protein